MLDVLGDVMLVLGALALLTAGIGVHRLPDVVTRLHAVSVGTVGSALVLLGSALQAGTTSGRAELVFASVLLLATAPVGAHLLARRSVSVAAGSAEGRDSGP